MVGEVKKWPVERRCQAGYVEQEQICGMCKLRSITRLWVSFCLVDSEPCFNDVISFVFTQTTTDKKFTSGFMATRLSFLLWRAASTVTMATTGIMSRLFLYGTQRVEVDGMDAFLALLKSRRGKRDAGLLTGSNLQPVYGTFLG